MTLLAVNPLEAILRRSANNDHFEVADVAASIVCGAIVNYEHLARMIMKKENDAVFLRLFRLHRLLLLD